MSVTIRDIARKSGYSIATISRAFSETTSVKPETRLKIRELAQELGYRHQPHVRREAARIGTVMLIVGDLMNPFYLGMIRGIQETLKEQGLKLAIFSSDYDPASEEELVRYAGDNRYDGLIMLTAIETAGLLTALKQVRFPVVLANRTIRSMDLNTVCIDNYRGGYMAAIHLADEGHRRIAHLAGPENSTASQDRERGFRDALRDCQISLSEDAVRHGDLKKDSGIRFGEYFLGKLGDCSAVFCANDLMATGFCERILAQGLSIPGDVSVICFDDSPAAISGPVKLTTISHDPYPMGVSAAEMMIDLITTDGQKPRKIVFPPSLAVRGSVRRIS